MIKRNLSVVLIQILVLFFIALIYFIGPVMDGKKISQHDITQFKGMSKELIDHREKYNEITLWTNSAFAGMPTYLISSQTSGNALRFLHRIFTIDNFRPVCFIFLYFIGAYIALLLFGFSTWLCFAGAIAYGLSSYFLLIIEAGHVSKVLALGYMPPIIAGVYLAFRGKAILGSLIMGIFLGLQILVNHLQITYYTLLIILIFGIYEIINAVKTKTYKEFLKPFPWLLLFVILAIGSNFTTIYTTYEYGKYSLRGQSELSANAENKTTGLDRDYATQWSYGINETLTLLIPDFMGGSSTGELKNTSNTYDFVKRNVGTREAKRFIENVPLYRGAQPGTGGPVYVGAVIIFLFVLGMFIMKGRVKWWLFVVTVFSIILSWGHNFNAFTNFMFDYFPGYNKFRSVTMALIMAEFAMPLLAIFTVREILNENINKKDFLKGMKYAFFGLGGLLLLILLISGSFDMSSQYDEQYISQGLQDLVNVMEKDRLALLRSDAFRSLIFIILTATLIYFTFLKKIKFTTFITLLSLLIIIDLWPVNKRYLNNKDFVSKKEDTNPFIASTSDLIILNDKDPNYKVLNISSGSPLQEANTSWFHKSLGGYHGAKMRRYQDLYDQYIYNEMVSLVNILQKRPLPVAIDSVMATFNVLNMLNTRYIIYSPEAPPIVNKHELGNAWFVKDLKVVSNADEEISAMASFNPDNEAITDKRFENEIKGLNLSNDSIAKISLTEYRANYLKYSSSTATENLAVFSEVYYDKGWKAYIDGKFTPHFRVNYILRALRVPPGNHTIEFKFLPDSYFISEKISLACSVLLILLAIGTGYRELKNKKEIKEEEIN